MKIIDKNKDYYDYLSGIYGIDNLVIFDRGGSKLLTDSEYIGDWKNPFRSFLFGKDLYNFSVLLILEIGYNHHLFQSYCKDLKFSLRYIGCREDNVKVSDKPICLAYDHYSHNFLSNLSIENMWIHCRYLREKLTGGYFMENPILKSSPITGFIPAETIYNQIYDGLLKNKTKDIEDLRNDIQKLESKGFDKKISFRHPIK